MGERNLFPTFHLPLNVDLMAGAAATMLSSWGWKAAYPYISYCVKKKYTPICLSHCSLIFLLSNIPNRIVQDRRLYMKVWPLGNCGHEDREFSELSISGQILGNKQSGVEQHKMLIILRQQMRTVVEAAGCLLNICSPSSFSPTCPFPAPVQVPFQPPTQSLQDIGKLVIQGWCSANCQTDKHLPPPTLDVRNFVMEYIFNGLP